MAESGGGATATLAPFLATRLHKHQQSAVGVHNMTLLKISDKSVIILTKPHFFMVFCRPIRLVLAIWCSPQPHVRSVKVPDGMIAYNYIYTVKNTTVVLMHALASTLEYAVWINTIALQLHLHCNVDMCSVNTSSCIYTVKHKSAV